MRISRIEIENFRNFHYLDVTLGESVVIMGENQVGKSNLMFALRLVLDPSLPDTARNLSTTDFWDGLPRPLETDDCIRVSVELADFDADDDLLAILADHLVKPSPMVARLTYEFHPVPSLDRAPERDADFEFVVYGGGRSENRLGYDLRKRIPLEVLRALRDVENDLARWTRSPLRPLLAKAQGSIVPAKLEAIAKGVTSAANKLTDLPEIKGVSDQLNRKLTRMVGDAQALQTSLGLSPADSQKLVRSLRLHIDRGLRDLSEASLGAANVLYLALRSLELEDLVMEGERQHTFFGIEEPEAHLHPHLQRLVFRSYLRPRVQAGSTSPENERSSISHILTTHSPHIVSVAPVGSIVLLRRSTSEQSTIAVSTEGLALTQEESQDIERYLDVSRAEALFGKGVLLVEGDAEKYIIPVLARRAEENYDLDALGITICSISGTNFVPYIKFFGPQGLDVPLAVLTDLDPNEKEALGETRVTEQIIPALLADKSPQDLSDRLAIAEANGVFLNSFTLEVDLIECGYWQSFRKTMQELCPVEAAVKRATERAKGKALDDTETFLKDIAYVGKGRFAQRLAKHIDSSPVKKCPDYILKGISHVANRI